MSHRKFLPVSVWIAFFVLVAAVLGFWSARRGEAPTPQVSFEQLQTADDLRAHSAEFERGVVEVTDGVYAAIGYGLANSILLQGPECRIVVDVMETYEEAVEVRRALETAAPSAGDASDEIGALIYTHNHADHVFGAAAFVDSDSERKPAVYAHESTNAKLDRVLNVLRPVLDQRSARMFGSHLDADGLVNAGIGPFLGLRRGSRISVVRPTVVFDERLETEICGLSVRLVHAPGETDDQLFVWLPEQRVLLPGDNLYKTFPNLYTIRGTPYRDVDAWVGSLDAMRALSPEHLVPSHTRPISGAEEIRAVLNDYRDAIQFVHDQTVRGINRGLTPDELVEVVRLPQHLAKSPYLAEFYGKVEWSVRSIFIGYLGWFSGDPADLHPLAPLEKARTTADLAGGVGALREHAAAAVEDGELQWALELTGALLRLDDADAEARALRVEALRRLGEAESNPNARHWYLTAAAELRDGLRPGLKLDPTAEVLREIPLAAVFKTMAVNLDPEASAEVDQKMSFVFPDADEAFTLHVRRSVAEVRPSASPDAPTTLTVDSQVWKEIVSGLRNPVAALATGEIQVEGKVFDLVGFLRLFKAPEE